MWAGLLSMPLLLCSSRPTARPTTWAPTPGTPRTPIPTAQLLLRAQELAQGAGVGLAGRMPSFKNKVASLLKALHMKIT